MKTLLLFLLLSLPALAQEPIRLCTYNVLNFSTETSGDRVAALETVLDEVVPTILVAHEIAGLSGATRFQQDVLQFVDSRLTLAPFVDGPDSDNALYVDTTRVTVVAHTPITTDLRNLDAWVVAVNGTTDTLLIVGCHLKAADDKESRTQRAEEASAINSILHTYTGRFGCVVAGDLNVYNSDEEAYQILTTFNTSVVVDPINKPGDWHNNEAFAGIHTQATHDSAVGGFISGGVDDRFDFLLLSPSMMTKYVAGSYTAFGNDGQHFNKSINAEPANNAVSQTVANALFNASDHLPVYLDMEFQGVTGVEDVMMLPKALNLW